MDTTLAILSDEDEEDEVVLDPMSDLMRSVGQAQDSRGRQTTVNGVQRLSQGGSVGAASREAAPVASLDNSILLKLLEQQQKQLELLSARQTAKERDSRKRKREEFEEEDAEPDMELRENWVVFDGSFEDDGVTKLDWRIRGRIQNPSAAPSAWWPSGQVTRKAHPVRGSSLYLEHLAGTKGAHIHTVRSLHDRTSYISLKSLLSKNNGQSGESKANVIIDNVGSSATAVRMEKAWKSPDSCYEVVDAVWNYCNVVFQIRPFSYEALALLRGLHNVR